MKKIVILLAVASLSCFLSIISNAQAPSWLWAKNAGGTHNDVASSLAVDASGNTYLTGWFWSPVINFDTITLTNADASGYSGDIFIVKYDANGHVIWAKSAGGTGFENANSVSVSASGDIYVAGYFYSSTLTFDTIILTNAGSCDIFLVKYDTDGNVLWAKSAGGTGKDRAYAVAADASGNSYVSGYFWSDTLIFNTTILTNSGYNDLFLVKYDGNGNVLWAKSAGGTSYDEAYSVAVDTSGNTLVAGYFYSKVLTFDTITLTNADTSTFTCDLFLAKYDPGGNVLWAKSAGGMAIDEANSVTVHSSGTIYLAGGFGSDSITFGSTVLQKAGGYDLFLTQYDLNGNVLWAKSAGGSSWENVNSVSVNSSGNAYIAGCFFSPTLIFGSTTLSNADTSGGTPDLFVAQYDANGNVLWAKSAGGLNDDEANSVAVDASGNIHITGFFYSDTLLFNSTILTNAGGTDIFIAKSDSTITGMPGAKLSNSINFLIYPNPGRDKIKVIIPEKATIDVLTIEGQVIKTINSERIETTIDVVNLSSGLYILKAKTDQGIAIKKFIKR